MLETKVIQVTGRGSNVNLDIDDSTPFDDVVQGLRNHLLANRLMYSRGTITVNVGRRMLDKGELTRIKELIEKESGVTVSRFWCPPDVLEQALSEDIGFGVAISSKDDRLKKEPVREEIAHNDPRLFQKQPAAESGGPAGLELWAPYIMEVSQRVEVEKPSVTEDAVAMAEPEKEVPAKGPVAVATGAVEQAAEAKAVAPPPSGDTSDGASDGKEEAAPPAAVTTLRGKTNEAPKGKDAAGDTTDTTIETKWEVVGRAEVVPVNRAAPVRELSGLNRGNEALLIKTHCRSGEVIRYAGDVVVMADVNPGSEIIADGDILVFGSLRGFAHAGAGGDIQATIIAQNFETPRLQIGPYVGVDPKPRKRARTNSTNPRMAYVRRRSVYVAPYTGRFGEYSGGTLYDG
jgi:septum formation inhibitor MinC